MNLLAKIMKEESPGRWEDLALLDERCYNNLMLSIEVVDITIDYLTEKDSMTLADLVRRVDQAITDNAKF